MGASKYRGPERRRYMRLDADCAIDYIKLGDDLKPLRDIVDDSYSKDISAGGIRFASSQKIPPDSFIELHIKIPTINKFLTAIGKVIRCDAQEGGGFEVAISFVWISKTYKELIDKYVKGKKLEKLRTKMKG